jgi:hypothetical protein
MVGSARRNSWRFCPEISGRVLSWCNGEVVRPAGDLLLGPEAVQIAEEGRLRGHGRLVPIFCGRVTVDLDRQAAVGGFTVPTTVEDPQ